MKFFNKKILTKLKKKGCFFTTPILFDYILMTIFKLFSFNDAITIIDVDNKNNLSKNL